MTKPNGWTGGAWEFEECGRTGDGDKLSLHHEIRPKGTDGWLDGEYMCVSGICTVETARLIAAAPSLYEALAEAVLWDETTHTHSLWVAKARAALSAAKGERDGCE